MNRVRIAVLSDIHAFSKSALSQGEPDPSYVETSASSAAAADPFASAEILIKEASLSADILVCCGDIGDKAHPSAIQYAWGRINGLAATLEAGTVLVTSGNHDLDSRHNNGYDARATLQTMPGYPFDDESLNNEYWARNVVVVEREGCRFAILNSAAFHGQDGDEWRHGRVSQSTIDYLRRRLDETPARAVNVLICHHHVHTVGSVDLGDQSQMRDAQLLTELLGDGRHGSWLIIHGHRHWPSLTYAAGTAISPVVFSAGSFSAVLHQEIAGRARNQFYIIDMPTEQGAGRLRGQFRAWDYIWGAGFSPAREMSGLPHVGGFGSRLSGLEVAEQIATALDNAKADLMKWAEIVETAPEIQFLTPADLSQFRHHLKSLNLEVHETEGRIRQIGRSEDET